MNLNEMYWSSRYSSGSTGWDIGYPSPPITQYLDQLDNKQVKILIPGAGNAYEASYAFARGFKNTYVLDIAKPPLNMFKRKNPSFFSDQLLNGDFFKHKGAYDLIIEQTFFCAIDPKLRQDYVEKMHDLLSPNGKLIGVLFDRVFDFQGPPFGGSKDYYYSLFKTSFEGVFAPCNNSIPERMGSELWINLNPK